MCSAAPTSCPLLLILLQLRPGPGLRIFLSPYFCLIFFKHTEPAGIAAAVHPGMIIGLILGCSLCEANNSPGLSKRNQPPTYKCTCKLTHTHTHTHVQDRLEKFCPKAGDLCSMRLPTTFPINPGDLLSSTVQVFSAKSRQGYAKYTRHLEQAFIFWCLKRSWS